MGNSTSPRSIPPKRSQSIGPTAQSGSVDVAEIEAKRRREENVATLKRQIRLLEDIKQLIDNQHAANQAHFLAIKDRDERSSRQGLWLNIAVATVSLILGWLLSLLGSPASALHALGH